MSSDQIHEKLTSITEKYVKVKELLDEQQTFGSEREPYELKYKAIGILKEMEIDLNNAINSGIQEKEKGFIMLAIVHLNRGILHVDTEELKAGEDQFMKCIDLLKDRELEPEAVLVVLSALNQLGIIWSRWSQPAKAKAFLDRAERIYKDFTDTKKSCQVPVSFASHFGITDTQEDLHSKPLERIHTLTLYYLAQVYGALKNHHKSAVYCHMTLCRQLEENDVIKDLDYIEWALNAATLSQYFMKNEGFPQAKHHLAAASYILKKYEDIMKEKHIETESEIAAAEYERFKHRSADVARCWAKYGILLLSLSKQRLLQKAEKDETDLQDSTDSQLDSKAEKDSERSFDDLKFDILMDDIKPFADEITDAYLLDFNDARPVFLNVQKWLDQAKSYYTLEDHASDYVEIIQDMSQAYKYLSFFEEMEDRQAKMHKRRVDILEATVQELNPQYYKIACRQIWMELGETYSDILDIKLDRLQISEDNPDPHALTKINHLAESAIKNFQLFLNSLENNSTDAKTVTFSDDVVQPALGAYFQMGRLYNKIITPDKSIQLENTQNSINAYRFVIDYCETHPKAAELMKQELTLCQEIVNLLPMKADKLRQELMNSGTNLLTAF
ncbi:hypothetical protein KPH14_006465 [Odynerus spinipes]|uniref:KIF-binding protein n=1 Tax=Odynerus spinipes TaxID=1348599 RepID=A0AAD9RQP7_9HYME|nr:hypothetical protein KPH14_006465 [Odynerus spinipes]